MNFSYLENGTVTGLNRVAMPDTDELTGTCTPQDLIHGYTAEFYTAPEGIITPKSQGTVDELKAVNTWETSKQKATDSALKHLNAATDLIQKDDVHAQIGLITLVPDRRADVENYATALQTHINTLMHTDYPNDWPEEPEPPTGIAELIANPATAYYTTIYSI